MWSGIQQKTLQTVCVQAVNPTGQMMYQYFAAYTQVNKAAKLFRQAGCVQSDIKAALTSHIKRDEIDIPEDEPEQPKKVPPLLGRLPLR